uniref:Uncharacterized protein n=1 Tax=Kalanchoe fedtschenkoi TaxID=63787 RepID=A0A7N0V930_KALFE
MNWEKTYRTKWSAGSSTGDMKMEIEREEKTKTSMVMMRWRRERSELVLVVVEWKLPGTCEGGD